MTSQAIVEFRNVSFSYGPVPVLKNINLSIGPKDFLGLIGPNGGGKTTLLKLIIGLLSPTSGHVSVFNTNPKNGRKFIGYVPQVTTFDFTFPISVLEVVLMGRLSHSRLGRKYNRHDLHICKQALLKVGLHQHHQKQIGRLSGGQMQRVLVARALATKPRLLLLDEPFSNIDSDWQTAFYHLLRQLNKQIAIVLVTHDISVLANYVSKIACVNTTVIQHGPTEKCLGEISKLYQSPDFPTSHQVVQNM